MFSIASFDIIIYGGDCATRARARRAVQGNARNARRLTMSSGVGRRN